MYRMKQAGYEESYRKNVLQHAVRIFKMRQSEAELGKRPLYREKSWNRLERNKKKKGSKYNWSNKGGHIAPIMVPCTPNGELARELRLIVEQEQREGIKLKIVETGGRTIKSQVQRSNPTETPGCNYLDCVPCKEGRGQGGSCTKSNVHCWMSCEARKCIWVIWQRE